MAFIKLQDKQKRTPCSEENELLDITPVKMSDTPFCRSGSQDEMVEDYDDDDEEEEEEVGFNTPCFKNRTGMEKFLFCFLLGALVIIVGLAIGLTRPRSVPVTHCKSSPCVEAAGSLLSALDWQADPCTDFYQFACGKWLKSQPIPEGYYHWDRFQELSDKNLYLLSSLIDSDTQSTETFKKTQTLYRSCLSAEQQSREQILNQFRTLLDEAGGWSLSRGSNISEWNFMVTLETMQRYGAWPFFQISVDVDERDPTNRHIIKLDVGETFLPSGVFRLTNSVPENTPGSNGSDRADVREARELKNIFLNETVHLLTSFGASPTEALARAEDILLLDSLLASISADCKRRFDHFQLYNVLPVWMLQSNYSMINWMQHFLVLGFPVTADTEVVVLHTDYMSQITKLINEYHQAKDNKLSILRDYLAISFIRTFKPFFSKSLFEAKETEEDVMEEVWKRCTYYTNKLMSFSTGALFVKGIKAEDSIRQIEKLIGYVKNAFREFSLKKYWMDKETQKRAEEKIDALINKISYPSQILNNTFLDNYYKTLSVVSHDWFTNLLSWKSFLLKNMGAQLSQKPDRTSSWLRPPVTENAYYSRTNNDIVFPIAMFSLPFYIPNGPSAVNFGAMGSIIGHELTHAFDIQGRQYDGHGKLVNWWNEQTAQNFLLTASCLRQQYSNIQVQGVKIDENFTIDENIADNSGLRAATYAYEVWVNEFGDELILPGVNLTASQIFYTSYAQMYCSKWTDHGLFYHILTDPHSPGSARVNIALSNSQRFHWAFQCPLDTPMNPRVKCEVW